MVFLCLGGGTRVCAKAAWSDPLCPLPAVFVEDRRQGTDESVRYIFSGNGATIRYDDSGCVFSLIAPGKQTRIGTTDPSSQPTMPPHVPDHTPRDVATLSVSFPGANRTIPVGVDGTGAKMYYYLGDAAPQTGLRTFRRVVYPNLYDGIDLHIRGGRSRVKYEFHVAPGADYAKVRIHYEGIDRLFVDDEGALHVLTPHGRLIDRPPHIYRLADGKPRPLRGAYRLIDRCTYGFEITDPVPPGEPIVIDPELIWSCFVGGGDYDYALGVAADSLGNTIIAGDTRSNIFYGAATPAGADAFVASLDADGALRWVACIGGRGGDSALNLAVDASDNILVTGLTASDDMPARTNAYHYGTDAFVAKLDADGNLLWTTYLGGNDTDQGFGIAVDAAGGAVVAGYTESRDFQHRRNSYWGGSFDGFAAAVSADGAVQWVDYIGWTGSDYCAAAAVDAAGDYLVAGTSSSAALPQAVNGRFGADDAFIAVLSPDGTLRQSRFLGGAAADRGCDIAVSRWGQILVAGDTESTNFVGARNSGNGRKDAFISILDTVQGEVRTTYFGGDGIDSAWALAEDALGNLIIVGSTYSQVLASSDNLYSQGQEAFAAAFSAAGTLLFSSYLGGGGDDCAFGIAVDGANHILVAGSSGSTNFVGAERYNGGSRDGFVVKLAGVSGTAPDLVVTHGSTRIAAVAGEKATVQMQVENTGAVDALPSGPGYFSTALYLADVADPAWDHLAAADVAARFNLTRLNAAAVHDATMDIDVPEGPGTYYLRARTDDFDSVPEEREYNNWGRVITLTVTEPVGEPDLVVAKPAQQTISVIRGRTVTVDVQIKNIGDADAVASGSQYFITRLYRADGPDTDWDSLTSEWQPIERTMLAAGASYAGDVRFAADMAQGTYSLRAKVDEAGAVAETDEVNNWGEIITLTVLEAPALADLTVVAEDGMAIRGTPAHRVDFVVDVRNIGDANAVTPAATPIQAALYLANYAGVNWDKLPARNRVATAQRGPLAAGEIDLLTFVFDAPAEQGAYCLRAKVDTSGVIEEVSEQNNWGPVVPFIVDANALPDILVAFADANDITKRPFENVDITVEVVNAGPGPADPFPAAYFDTLVYLSRQTATTADANTIGLLHTGVLEPREVQAGAVSFASPSQRGTYYLHARTDIGDDVGEGNEYNNRTPRVTLVVDGAPLNNEPPVFVDIGPKTVAEGQTLTFTVVAVDPEGDPLTYLALSRPTGATFADAVFTWTPAYDQAGEWMVMFLALDGESNDWQAVAITVTNTNRPPVMTLPHAMIVDENQPVTFAVNATDPDGDAIVHMADNLPAGATFVNGQFSWTPSYGQAGDHVPGFSASDGHADGATSATVIITVNNVNRLPVALAGPDRTAADADGDGAEVVLLDGASSHDPDGDALTYRWTDADGRVLAAEASPLVTFAVGVHVVTLTVADSRGGSHADTVTVDVRRVNRPPAARAGEDQTLIDRDGDGLEMVTLDGSVSSDPDGVIVKWHWLIYDTVIAAGAMRQIALPLGTFTLTLRVTDDNGASGGDAVTITVAAPPVNTAPVLAPIAARTVRENQPLTFTVTAEDAEGDAIALSAADLPAGATFEGGIFTFRPWYDQSGPCTVTFTASDGRAQDTLAVSITVEDVVLANWYRKWLERATRR